MNPATASNPHELIVSRLKFEAAVRYLEVLIGKGERKRNEAVPRSLSGGLETKQE